MSADLFQSLFTRSLPPSTSDGNLSSKLAHAICKLFFLNIMCAGYFLPSEMVSR